MPNGMLAPEEFEKETDSQLKINVLYRLVYELYRKRRYDEFKNIWAGMLGGAGVMLAKIAFWK